MRAKVVRGEMSGRTAKEVSPTRPRVTLAAASVLMGSFRYGATNTNRQFLNSMGLVLVLCFLTKYEHTIAKRVHGPHIRRPVGMTQSPRKGKESAQHLRNLLIIHKRPECQSRDNSDTEAKLDAIQPSNVEDRPRAKTVCPKQVNKVRRSEVEVNVLQAEHGSEEDTARQ